MADDFVRVAAAGDFAPGEVKVFEVADERVAVCRVGDAFYAIQDLCTHDDGPLGEGTLDGAAIECPRHGARFDVRTGEVLRMPAVAPVRTFPVEVRDGEIYVKAEEE